MAQGGLGIIDHLQGEIEAIYGLSLPWRARDFLLARSETQALGGAQGRPEALLVREDEGELSLGLYLSPELLERLSAYDPDDPRPRILHEALGAFTTVLEGVSHFVYLVFRALRGEAVSLLDLETQAEVDKFVTSLLYLWRRGCKDASGVLRRRLFHRVRYAAGLSESEGGRYRTANDLAGAYCRSLEARFVGEGSPEGLLREVRRVYRLGGAHKRAHLRRAAAAG